MNDFGGWCRQLRHRARLWGERVISSSSSSPRLPVDEDVAFQGLGDKADEVHCPDGPGDPGIPFRSSGMDQVRQGGKRGVNCFDRAVLGSESSEQRSSDLSTRENIVAGTGEEYLEAEQVTTAMSKEDKRLEPEGLVQQEDRVNTSRSGSLTAADGSRPSCPKSNTFPRSRTESLDASKLSSAVSGAIVGCPPHGAKSVMGRRAKMEDTFVAIPDLIGVAFADSLNEIIPPRIADQMHLTVANDSCSTAKRSGGELVTAAISGENGAAKPRADSDTILHTTSSKISEGKRREELLVGSARDVTCSPCASATPKKVLEQIHFFGVFDGHGGADAAQHCQETMHERLKEAIVSSCPKAAMERAAMERGLGALDGEVVSELEASICSSEAFSEALIKAFKVTDEAFAKLSGEEEDLALVGTTAVVALLSSQSIYVANAGDSRAVLLRNGRAMALTDDHKAAREDETARVEAAGGQILFWNGVRVMGLLAVSRAIGDHSLRPYVIADPEVTVVNRQTGDELLVMASDGLWDVITNHEACSLARRCLLRARQKGSTRENAARVAATVLTKAAVDRGSRDNVTVLVIDLMQDPDGQIDQALKMCMSEDLGTVRRENGIDKQESGKDDQDASLGGKDKLQGESTSDGGTFRCSHHALDGGSKVRTASAESPMASVAVASPRMTVLAPTPFMGTPFDDVATGEVGDGISLPSSAFAAAEEGTAEFELAPSQSYKSPFESLLFSASGSKEY
jgi:protein phosphatase 2C